MTEVIQQMRSKLGPAARGVFDDIYVLMVKNDPIGDLPYDAQDLARLLKIRTHQVHIALAALIKAKLLKRKAYGLYWSPAVVRAVFSQAFTKPGSKVS